MRQTCTGNNVGTLNIVKDETATALRMRHLPMPLYIVPKTVSSALGSWVDDAEEVHTDDVGRWLCCVSITVCYIDIATDEWVKHKIDVEYTISNLP